MPSPTTHILGPAHAPSMIDCSSPELLARALEPEVVPVAAELLSGETDRRRFFSSEAQFHTAGVRDIEFGRDPDQALPDLVFDRLRWGGQYVHVADTPEEIDGVLDAYRDAPEWIVDHKPTELLTRQLPGVERWLAPWRPAATRDRLFQKRRYYAAARKILLDPVSRLTARHSYDVRLVRARGKVDKKYATDGMVVLKRVPTMQQAIDRLTQTCPDVPPDRS